MCAVDNEGRRRRALEMPVTAHALADGLALHIFDVADFIFLRNGGGGGTVVSAPRAETSVL